MCVDYGKYGRNIIYTGYPYPLALKMDKNT